MPEPIISVRDVRVTYDKGKPSETKAVNDISLDIYPEEFVIFFGPSGCGKSTLLYAIAGLELSAEGDILVQGKNIAKFSEKEIINYHRRTIGMIFQQYYLINSLSVLANAVLPQIFINKKQKEREGQARKLFERFGILDAQDRFPTEMSGGQQQRVSIVRALMNNPPIILADEPVGNLDSKSAESVLKLIWDLNEKDKRTIVMVTHNPNHLDYAHRIFYLKDGKIVREVRNTHRRQVREQEVRPFVNYGLRDFAQLFPTMDEEALKAKMITSYLLEQVDMEVQRRVEKLVRQYKTGKIDRNIFLAKISAPVREEGIGMYQSHAERLTDRLVDTIAFGKHLKERLKEYPRNYAAYDQILNSICDHLLKDSDVRLSDEQIERMKSLTKARLEGSLDREKFQDMIDKSFSEGGVGLNVRTARNIARQLEMLLIDFNEIPKTRTTVGQIKKTMQLNKKEGGQIKVPLEKLQYIDRVINPTLQKKQKEGDITARNFIKQPTIKRQQTAPPQKPAVELQKAPLPLKKSAAQNEAGYITSSFPKFVHEFDKFKEVPEEEKEQVLLNKANEKRKREQDWYIYSHKIRDMHAEKSDRHYS